METWRIGRTRNFRGSDCIITNNDEDLPDGLGWKGEEANDYYGGSLVCESIYRKKDAALISAAPDLLEGCRIALITAKALLPVYERYVAEDKSFEQYISDIKNIIGIIDNAIAKATTIK